MGQPAQVTPIVTTSTTTSNTGYKTSTQSPVIQNSFNNKQSGGSSSSYSYEVPSTMGPSLDLSGTRNDGTMIVGLQNLMIGPRWTWDPTYPKPEELSNLYLFTPRMREKAKAKKAAELAQPQLVNLLL